MTDENPIDVFREPERRIADIHAAQQFKEGMRRFIYKEPYNLSDELEGEAASATINEEPTKTEQHHKDDVDINVMMERLGVTNKDDIPVVPIDMVNTYDFTEVVDLQEALNRINRAKELFAQMPARIRSRFDNDPAKMYDYLGNEENHEEAIRLGILKNEPPPTAPSAQKTPPGDPGVSPST